MKDNKNRRPTHALCFLADEDLLHSPDYESLSSIHSASLRNALFNFIHYKIEEILSDTKDREFDKQVQIENEFTDLIHEVFEERRNSIDNEPHKESFVLILKFNNTRLHVQASFIKNKKWTLVEFISKILELFHIKEVKVEMVEIEGYAQPIINIILPFHNPIIERDNIPYYYGGNLHFNVGTVTRIRKILKLTKFVEYYTESFSLLDIEKKYEIENIAQVEIPTIILENILPDILRTILLALDSPLVIGYLSYFINAYPTAPFISPPKKSPSKKKTKKDDKEK